VAETNAGRYTGDFADGCSKGITLAVHGIVAMASKEIRVDGDRLFLRPLTEDDLTDEYLGWVTDPETTTYLDVQHTSPTIESLKAYLATFDNAHTNFAFAIVVRDPTDGPGTHIGNITLRVNRVNRYGTEGILVSKAHQGKGYGTEARSLLYAFGFDELGLEKIVSGSAAANSASIASNERLGFVKEGHFAEHVLVGETRVDSVQLGLLKRNFRPYTP
jgi:RimJ/RimL family protein N-acetyltransferase